MDDILHIPDVLLTSTAAGGRPLLYRAVCRESCVPEALELEPNKSTCPDCLRGIGLETRAALLELAESDLEGGAEAKEKLQEINTLDLDTALKSLYDLAIKNNRVPGITTEIKWETKTTTSTGTSAQDWVLDLITGEELDKLVK